MRILVAEDYEPVRKSVCKGLEEAGFAVDQAADGAEAVALCETTQYDVIILDLMLPKVMGEKVLATIRERGHHSRVLILSAKSDVSDRVACLDMGADDYLVKPFDYSELLSRVRALGRRVNNRTSPEIIIGDMTVNTARREVVRHGEKIELTKREFSLLEFLANNAGKVVSRDDIKDHIYDQFDQESSSNVVDVYIGYLRKKIERDDWPRVLHTRRGHGYLLGTEP